jgi:hypothetical protein
MSISGSTPSHAYYGVPVSGIRPAGETSGSRMAPPSGPFVGRGNKCSANDDTCRGNRVKNQELCAGHLRSALKQAAGKPKPSDGSVVVHAETGVVVNGV